MTDSLFVTVLVPAAGQGRRLGGERKQFRLLGGQPLLVQTLRSLEAHPAVQALVVAAPETERERIRQDADAAGIERLVAVVAGGSTRQASVRAAFEAAPAETEIVLVHDGVRPFIETVHLDALIQAVVTHAAAALAVPATDTMRRGEDGRFRETVPRADLYRMQTPQGFTRDLFARALAETAATATDDVALVQALGADVHIVEGSTRNIKVTTPADWALAQILWPHWQAGRWTAG